MSSSDGRALPEVIEQPAGRRDDDVGAALERADLLAEADAAEDGGDPHAGVFREQLLRCAAICTASSRVGARIRARVLPRGLSISALSSGKPKAADLPLPVAALARTSRPSRAGGIAAVCTGRRLGEAEVATARKSCGRRPSVSKLDKVVRFYDVRNTIGTRTTARSDGTLSHIAVRKSTRTVVAGREFA